MSGQEPLDKEPAPAALAEDAFRPTVRAKKVFVPKKVAAKTGGNMERRTRHILLSSLDAANLVRQAILDFQRELEAQPAEDLDKPLLDQQKVEAFFSRLAKKYSACPTRVTGGDLGWVFAEDGTGEARVAGENAPAREAQFDGVLTAELKAAVMRIEKFQIPEPVKTRLGFHIILVCEARLPVKKEGEEKADEPNIVDAVHQNAAHAKPKTWESWQGPS